MNTTTQLHPYLFFGGNCAEALEFYRTVLGARIDVIMRYKEAPDPPPPGMLPPGYEDKVMHASFHLGTNMIMASDGCGEVGGFNGFMLSLSVSTGPRRTVTSPPSRKTERSRCPSARRSGLRASAWCATASASAG
jgi:uncharacterized glyoxalase superfamily protein PhnB